MLLNKIEKVRLTNGQVPIADYFSKNEEKVCFMTINEVAQELQINDTAIMRFCRALGYSGYKELQKELQANLLERIRKDDDNDLISRVKEDSRDENLVSEYFDLAVNNLSQSILKTDKSKYKEAAESILKAKRKYIVGFRGCAPSAQSFAQGLRYLVDNVLELSNGDSDAIEKISEIDSEDVCFIISYSRYGKIDRLVKEIATENGAKVIVVTDRPSSVMTRDADIVIHTEVVSKGFFNSQICSMFTIEALMLYISTSIPREALSRRISQIDYSMKQILY